MNFNTTETRLFEANPELRDGLQVQEIARLERSLSTAELNRLKKNIQLGKIMTEVCAWYDLPETQTKFADYGISWSREDIAQKVFLCSKSQMFKNIKGFAFHTQNDTNLSHFNTAVNRLRIDGTKISKSLENYNKFSTALSSGNLTSAREVLIPTAVEITPETIATDIQEDTENYLFNTPNAYEISVVAPHNISYKIVASATMQFSITNTSIPQHITATNFSIPQHIEETLALIRENLEGINIE